MSIFLFLEILIIFSINKKYSKSPKKGEYKVYEELIKNLNSNTFTLATLTVAILAFIERDNDIGTQTFLIYGLSLLFVSAFLSEFSGLKKIIYFIQRRILHYWFYSIILAISTFYVSPSFTFESNFKTIIVILGVTVGIIVLTHTYSIYMEIKNSCKKKKPS